MTGPTRAFAPNPAGIDHVQVAALTAWQALVDTADLRAGQRVLIHAAARGAGHLAAQIARDLGAHVSGTFPLAEGAQAHALAESGHTTGKLVITVRRPDASAIGEGVGESALIDLRSCRTMDRYEQFHRAAIDKGIPSDEVDMFAGQLRFAICAGGCGQDEKVVGQSGGVPRLPVGVEWPGSGGGTPLPFIASLDCAALPRVEGLPLPADGSLLFFLHHEDDHMEDGHEFARVLYVPAGTDTAVAALPCDPDSEIYSDGIPFLIPEYRLSAQVEAALPQWVEERDDGWPFDVESETVQRLFAELKHIDELCDVVDDLWPADGASAFRIGGHYVDIGGDENPWYRMASANVRNRSGAEPGLPMSEKDRLIGAEEYRLSQEWVPLAQFCTESEFHYGCFLISADDLAAERFDEMRSFTRFTE